MKRYRLSPALAALLLLVLAPTAFAQYAAPDYSDRSAWAALPGVVDGADVVPQGSGAVDRQATADTDVFFIHPTTFSDLVRPNAAYDEPGFTKSLLDIAVLRNQASVFNGCCRVFAPRYRQASIRILLKSSRQRDVALDLAYSDIRHAFDYYLAHYNHGRPFIIASHSQGSILGMRLVGEKIRDTPLARRLIAAYLVGIKLPAGEDSTGLPACASATQTGCVISWSTDRPGAGDILLHQTIPLWLGDSWQPIGNRPVICVNPISWTLNGSAPATGNLGAEVGRRSIGPLAPVTPEFTGATCNGDNLLVDVPANSNVYELGGSYHLYDYNFFYMNIRRNAQVRVQAYLAHHH